jgi:hypothetical protein
LVLYDDFSRSQLATQAMKERVGQATDNNVLCSLCSRPQPMQLENRPPMSFHIYLAAGVLSEAWLAGKFLKQTGVGRARPTVKIYYWEHLQSMKKLNDCNAGYYAYRGLAVCLPSRVEIVNIVLDLKAPPFLGCIGISTHAVFFFVATAEIATRTIQSVTVNENSWDCPFKYSADGRRHGAC